MSLNTEEAENTEQNEIKELRDQLNETNKVVKQLSSQLGDLRDRVSRNFVCKNQFWLDNVCIVVCILKKL